MQKLLIFPFSGTGIEILDCLNDSFECIGFISDNPDHIGTAYHGVPILGRKALLDFPEAKVIAVPGSPTNFQKREKIIDDLELISHRYASVIHPSANIGRNVAIGYNVFIMAGVVVTSNATIGNHVGILPNTVIHHDSIIGNFTLIAANVTICGNVTIGKNSYIGAASSVKNGLTIGSNVLIGIGSNVISNVEATLTVIGNPAKVIRKKE